MATDCGEVWYSNIDCIDLSARYVAAASEILWHVARPKYWSTVLGPDYAVRRVLIGICCTVSGKYVNNFGYVGK